MPIAVVSPSLGIYATSIGTPPGHLHQRRNIRDRHGVKSAPAASLRYRRREQRTSAVNKQNTAGNRMIARVPWTPITTPNVKPAVNGSCHGDQVFLRVNDVVSLMEQTKEVASQENRRSMLEEAQKAIRYDMGYISSSRPHSVIGMGLQSLTSPMPLSAKDRSTKVIQMDHIPALLPLPSDRAFIPSPDQDNPRHANTPTGELDQDEISHSVSRQCCEIMGRSMCKSCQKLERRMLNRERAERECPRMRISQENITTTQVVKRFYPNLTDSEIQDKIARGEIARVKMLSRKYFSNDDDDSNSESSDDEKEKDLSTQDHLTPVGHVVVSKKPKKESTVIHSDNPLFALTKLKTKLKGLTSTPLYFTDLKSVQAKILSGEIDRRKHLIKPPPNNVRLKSAVSTLSTASSNKSSLSKKGMKLAEFLMPVFVSPKKVKVYQEPSYKAYFEPPLLSKRRQIPNPSFFAGSSETYSLPERLPDIIEFADSKIKALERQGRSTSSMSFASNFSEDDPLSSSRRELEKGDKEGEVMLGDSMTSSTPRMWLKSTNNIIDENFAGEEEHATQDDVTFTVSGPETGADMNVNGDKSGLEKETDNGCETNENDETQLKSPPSKSNVLDTDEQNIDVEVVEGDKRINPDNCDEWSMPSEEKEESCFQEGDECEGSVPEQDESVSHDGDDLDLGEGKHKEANSEGNSERDADLENESCGDGDSNSDILSVTNTDEHNSLNDELASLYGEPDC